MDAIVVVEKTLNDPFAGTDLKAVLEAIAPDRVLIAMGDRLLRGRDRQIIRVARSPRGRRRGCTHVE